MFSILIAKMALFVGNLLHRGSALPGSIALKLNKNILEKFKLPKNIIAVTGSAGKGTTSKLIAETLKSQGFKSYFTCKKVYIIKQKLMNI